MTLDAVTIESAPLLLLAGGVAGVVGGVAGALWVGERDLGRDVSATLGLMLAPPAVVPGLIAALAFLALG